MKNILCVLMIGAALYGCSKEKSSDTAGRISVSGAWALYPMVVKWAEVYQNEFPGIVIDISAGGAGKGMADALSGAVDLGMVSRDIKKDELDKGAWGISVVKDAVIPMINEKNPLKDDLLKRGLRKKEFAQIWMTGTLRSWNILVKSDKSAAIHVFTRSDACGAAETWAKYVGGSQEDLKGVGVYGDPGLADAVRNDELGIGFNNVNFAYDAKTKKPVNGIIPLPLDINGNGQLDPAESFYGDRDLLTKAIADNIFPSPPARNLHIVAKGIPEKKHVVKFLLWILNEGQRYVPDAGYICLTAEQLQKQIDELSK